MTEAIEGGWGTDESSNFLRNFTGVVEAPYFGTNPKIGEGQTLLLQWPVKVESVEDEAHADKIGEEENLMFSCGKDWETPDGGETAVHRSGNESKLFHASSAMGMLIDAILGKVANYGDNASRTDEEELVVDMGDAAETLRARGPATAAATWDGLRWEFAEVVVDYGMDKSDPPKPIQSRRAMPVRFLGVAEEDKVADKGKAKPAAKKTAAKKSAADIKAEKAAAAAATSSNGDADASDDPFAGIDVPDDLRAQLVALATEHEDNDDFRNAAYEIDELVEQDDLLNLLVEDEDGKVREALVG